MIFETIMNMIYEDKNTPSIIKKAVGDYMFERSRPSRLLLDIIRKTKMKGFKDIKSSYLGAYVECRHNEKDFVLIAIPKEKLENGAIFYKERT